MNGTVKIDLSSFEKELNKKYRHESNPKEKELHDSFINDFKDLDMSRIAFPSKDGNTPISYLNEREKQIVINVIQWLGSNVGTSFLSKHNFKLNK